MKVPRRVALRQISAAGTNQPACFARDQIVLAAGMAGNSMVCCMLLALVLGPVGLSVMPNSPADGGSVCCVNSWRASIAWMLILSAGLCLAAGLFIWSQPSVFQHICRVFRPL